MDRLILYPTITEQWQTLVNEAKEQCGLQLSVDVESYLVFLLQRYTQNTALSQTIVALDYLHSLETTGEIKAHNLQDLGDNCLVLSGFFPEHVYRRLVTLNYFVELGRHAYDSLSEHVKRHPDAASLYHSLYLKFIELVDILHCIREMNGEFELSLIQAEELWHEFHSKHALQRLRKATNTKLILSKHSKSHLH